MFPMLPPTPSEPQQPQRLVPNIEVKPSRRFGFIKALSRWSVYGFWFSVGLCAANLARMVPSGWVVYLAFMGSVSGFLLITKPENAAEELLSTRRISGLAIALSAFAFWDVAMIVATLPVRLGLWVFPVWLLIICGAAIIGGALLMQRG